MASPSNLELIKATICSITSYENAREGQVKVVARLVFEKANTVLVAATVSRPAWNEGGTPLLGAIDEDSKLKGKGKRSSKASPREILPGRLK
ncbi:hypothetical protein B0T26DRAFT_730459, partial [Lasiosphaeria miniovina]